MVCHNQGFKADAGSDFQPMKGSEEEWREKDSSKTIEEMQHEHNISMEAGCISFSSSGYQDMSSDCTDQG